MGAARRVRASSSHPTLGRIWFAFTRPTASVRGQPSALSGVTDDMSHAKRALYRPWWAMIVVSIAIVPVSLFYKLRFHEPVVEYTHLLVTYHFGFAKRAFIGTLLSLFASRVSVSYVYIIGMSAWLIALLLFVVAFKRAFGFSQKNLPLFAFMAGSPFFFKNFMYSIGYFDIYGCIVALAALLLPVDALFPLVLAAGCVILVLIHPVHLLLYCPVIALILVVRYYLPSDFSPARLAYGLILALAILVVFVASVFFGQMPVPPETWAAYVQSRATIPIDPTVSYVWYSTIRDEMTRTWTVIGEHALRFPIYAVLIALHLPVVRYFKSLILGLADPSHKVVVVGGVATICVGYLIMGAIVFDYSRWVSNWAVCMFVGMLAVRSLPSTLEDSAPAIAADAGQARTLGWVVALIPRVGITKPF
jgi:hypothetical protein